MTSKFEGESCVSEPLTSSQVVKVLPVQPSNLGDFRQPDLLKLIEIPSESSQVAPSPPPKPRCHRHSSRTHSSESNISGRSSISPNKKSPKQSKKNPSGSLYKFLQNKKDKAGRVLSYPKVEEQRDPDNPRHWFWAYCWDEKTEDGWKTRKRSVSVEKLAAVRNAMLTHSHSETANNQTVEQILQLI